MDIDHPQDPASENTASASELVRAKDILPGTIPILPTAERPFFPGQVIPLLIDPEAWGETIKAAQEKANGVIGLILVQTRRAEHAGLDDFYAMGTACRYCWKVCNASVFWTG